MFNKIKSTKQIIHRLATLLLTTLIVACTTTSVEQTSAHYVSHDSPIWQQQLEQLSLIKSYSAQGKLGYISSKERYSIGFDWDFKNDSNYKLFISSSLSSSTLTIQMINDILIVTDDEGRQRRGNDVHALLIDIIGMDFPIEQFPYWLKGEPVNAENYLVGEDYLLAQLSYNIDGVIWHADYIDYYPERKPALPKNIILKNGEQTLKIRIDTWHR